MSNKQTNNFENDSLLKGGESCPPHTGLSRHSLKAMSHANVDKLPEPGTYLSHPLKGVSHDDVDKLHEPNTSLSQPLKGVSRADVKKLAERGVKTGYHPPQF